MTSGLLTSRGRIPSLRATLQTNATRAAPRARPKATDSQQLPQIASTQPPQQSPGPSQGPGLRNQQGPAPVQGAPGLTALRLAGTASLAAAPRNSYLYRCGAQR